MNRGRGLSFTWVGCTRPDDGESELTGNGGLNMQDDGRPDCPPSPILPEHVEQTVRLIAKLHADHREAATPVQRIVELAVACLGSAGFLAALGGLAVCWVASNLALRAWGADGFDPPPFAYLELLSTLLSLCVMVLILMTQRRDDQLARHREQMTLELAILSEQKLAKIIELMEESRRENPLLSDRVDVAAEAMAEPADPQALGEAIKRSEE